ITFIDLQGKRVVDRFDYVLMATGRRPNVAGLGLENTSVPLDERGIPQFDRNTMQVGDLPIFIAGDVNNDVPLLHEASDEGRTAGANAARYPDVQSGLRRAPLAIVFSDPQLAAVGQRVHELEPGTYITGEVSFDNQGRSRIIRKNRGRLHVYA